MSDELAQNVGIGLGEYARLTDFDGNALPQMTKWLGASRCFRLDDLSRVFYPKTLLSQINIVAVFIKNALASTGAVLPKEIYKLGVGGSGATKFQMIQQVEYIAAAPTPLWVLADPWLPATGCPYGYGFWGIVAGPAICKTAAAYANGVAAAVGAPVTIMTEASTGRVGGLPDVTSDADLALAAADNIIGHTFEAIAASGTGDQSLEKWVMLKSRLFTE